MNIENKTQTEDELHIGDFVMKECPTCKKETRMRYDGRYPLNDKETLQEDIKLTEKYRKKYGQYTCQDECGGSYAINERHYKE